MDTILIVDFGAQYTQLIARRVRELNVYCEIVPFHKPLQLTPNVKGVILSGGPASVVSADAPTIDLWEAIGKVPVLGICYGAQLIAHQLGGQVTASKVREYGRAELHLTRPSAIFKGVTLGAQIWMSHSDSILQLPAGYQVTAHTESIPVCAFESMAGVPVYGLQFHPEVTHTPEGALILGNFVLEACGAKPEWTSAAFVESTTAQLRAQIGPEAHVLCALSGGVDSSVAAVLLNRAIPGRLHCIFVNNGLLRKDEYAQVLAGYHGMNLPVEGVDASEHFLTELAGITEPEAKRKTIGRVFIEVFEREAARLTAQGNIKFLAQGTIYPDVIESVSVNGPSATIKSHHNVGGLPERMNLQVVEPLRMLFKDEVRRVGRSLGIAATLLERHPFPGPGLAIRILGPISKARVALLQQADDIFISMLKTHHLYDKVWQAFAVLLPVSSVGVMGDERTYENVLALRAVTSVDGMTAEWAPLPHDFLADVSAKLINQVQGINRVVYDISSKPPATIEWE